MLMNAIARKGYNSDFASAGTLISVSAFLHRGKKKKKRDKKKKEKKKELNYHSYEQLQNVLNLNKAALNHRE